jgi:hypothetical protein
VTGVTGSVVDDALLPQIPTLPSVRRPFDHPRRRTRSRRLRPPSGQGGDRPRSRQRPLLGRVPRGRHPRRRRTRPSSGHAHPGAGGCRPRARRPRRHDAPAHAKRRGFSEIVRILWRRCRRCKTSLEIGREGQPCFVQ